MSQLVNHCRSERHYAGRRALALLLLSCMALSGGTFAAPAASPAENTRRAAEVIEQRCIVCHGCYDAPCQLKMEAWEGLERGASKALVYNGGRLAEAPLTRLFDDAQTAAEWRKKGFYSVLQRGNPDYGVMYRILQQKKAHPLPARGPLPSGFDFSLARDQQCPRPDEFARYEKDYPLWGMPYGLPGLNDEEHNTLVRWLEAGSPRPARPLLTDAERDGIERWETFLNAPDTKRRLMARYVYEHLFLASLYLQEGDNPAWFRLVRSRTPPGQALDLIVTRRPYDDPGVDRVYYRLQRMHVTTLRKTHMPYRFDTARMDWYRTLFLQDNYTLEELPGYGGEEGANPFWVYRHIPVRARYDFLLEEAQFTIMNFIKGPVCRGRIALNVIEDHFWVMFESPDEINPETDQEALERESANLRLPQSRTGTALDLFAWRSYAKGQQRFLKAKSEYLARQIEAGNNPLRYDVIWDGDGRNPNAALTVFRHFDTASVVKGFVGDIPKTAWVIDYPLLERIHYLLVAGFDVYGSAAHQLESRLYMDFLRIEGEVNFLGFMPDAEREHLAQYWYRDASAGVVEHLTKAGVVEIGSTAIEFTTDDPKTEFLTRLRNNIHGASAQRWDYRDSAGPTMSKEFEKLEHNVGAHNRFMPNVSFVNVVDGQRDDFYTIMRNSGYSNIAQLMQEEERRLPEEDSLTVVEGFIGAYPNQFFQVSAKQLALFARDIAALKSADDYAKLLDHYGVPRNAPWFWRVSDKLHQRQLEDGPLEAGLFDYSRYKGY